MKIEGRDTLLTQEQIRKQLGELREEEKLQLENIISLLQGISKDKKKKIDEEVISNIQSAERELTILRETFVKRLINLLKQNTEI